MGALASIANAPVKIPGGPLALGAPLPAGTTYAGGSASQSAVNQSVAQNIIKQTPIYQAVVHKGKAANFGVAQLNPDIPPLAFGPIFQPQAASGASSAIIGSEDGTGIGLTTITGWGGGASGGGGGGGGDTTETTAAAADGTILGIDPLILVIIIGVAMMAMKKG